MENKRYFIDFGLNPWFIPSLNSYINFVVHIRKLVKLYKESRKNEQELNEYFDDLFQDQ